MALAQITDEGLFEQIATAVLREADPLCAGLCHTGLNPDGMTRRSPLDGISYVRGADPPHLVAVHHTITAADSLARKWLYDPNVVTGSRAHRRSRTPAGDIVKTAALVTEERRRTPGLRASLILTTNEEPSEDLVRDVAAAGAAHGIEIEIWSRSRIAQFLDNRPLGHWIRRQLGIESQLLSAELLADLSRRSLRSTPPLDDADAWVPRALDRALATPHRQITFLVAGSGLGKSVACYRALCAYVERGGFGVILPHASIDCSMTIERAVEDALRGLHPQLAQGESAFTLCSAARPLLIVIEDVNRSGQPERLVEKLVGWAATSDGRSDPTTALWRILCPIWPQVHARVSEQARKAIEPMLLFPEPFSANEGQRAVVARVARAGRAISELTAHQVSAALGHDPLLIALHDYSTTPAPHEVIGRFIDGVLARLQSSVNELAHELRDALGVLAAEMLRRRRIDPTWREVTNWSLSTHALDRLRTIVRNGEIVRLGGPTADPQLLFRHDRVRDWLLVESAIQMELDGGIDEGILSDPYYSEILGAVAIRHGAPSRLLERMRRMNPLALFHALRLTANASGARAAITGEIDRWLSDPMISSVANMHLRGEVVAALQDADGADIPALVRRIPDSGIRGHLASLHNGDVNGGVEICVMFELGSGAKFRDREIAHAKLQFGERFIQAVGGRLQRPQEPGRVRSGLLHLAGHLGEPRLVDAVAVCWSIDETRHERLQEYLWAFARCCNDESISKHLAPICDAWAALPTEKPDPGHSSPRDDFAAHGLDWAFARSAPTDAALRYLVSRAHKPDLTWQITYMLNGVDHPIAVTWVATYGAARARERPDESLMVAVNLSDIWDSERSHARTMSSASRESLQDLWVNTANDRFLRRAAFYIWAKANNEDDLRILCEGQEDVVLHDDILVQRLARHDQDAIPGLLAKLRLGADSWFWWFHTRYVWVPELAVEVDRLLTQRREHAARQWNEEYREDEPIGSLLVRCPAGDAERILVRHWDHLRFASRFVQLALYLTTPELCRLATECLRDAPDPKLVLAHVAQRFGTYESGHPGVTRQSQLLVLEPYLDFLSDADRADLAEACNRAGWFDLRRQLFDKYSLPRRIAWNADDSGQLFDDVLRRGNHWIEHEIEIAQKTGTTWPEILAALERWLSTKRTIAALLLVTHAMAAKGTRGDIAALHVYEEMPTVAHALVEDTTFAVRRRSLR